MEKKCPICGKLFIARNVRAIYCGYDCQSKEMNRRKYLKRKAEQKTRKCEECGKEFKPKVGQQVTCSPECSWARHKKVSRERKPKLPEYGKCEQCGAEFQIKMRNQLFCDKCRKKKELVTKAVAQAENKPVKKPEDWVREADECGIDYGTYRGLVTVFGKTKEEIKALYGGNETAHAHAGQATRRAGGAMGVKLA